MAAVLIIIIVAIVLFLTFTKVGQKIKLRASGSATEALNKDASTPEGAKAYYNSAIDKKQEDYKKACDLEAQMLGKIKSYEDQIHALQKDNAKISQDLIGLVKQHNDEGAKVLLKRQAENEDKLEILKNGLKTLKDNEKVQKDTVDALFTQLNDLKAEKDNAVLTLETAQVTDSLHATSVDNTTDEMLQAVRDGVKKTKERSDGKTAMYESSSEAQVQKLNKSLQEDEVNRKLEELKKQVK